MSSLSTIILSVIVLFGLSCLRILLVARTATQGTLFELRFMTPPLLPDSYNVASMIPENPIIVNCAAALIKEGDRSILSFMLLVARFIEAIGNTLLSNWICMVVILLLAVRTVIKLYKNPSNPVGGAVIQEPSRRIIDLTFKAFRRTRFCDLLEDVACISRENTLVLEDMNYRLEHVEKSLAELYQDFMSKLDDSNYRPQPDQILQEPDALVVSRAQARNARVRSTEFLEELWVQQRDQQDFVADW